MGIKGVALEDHGDVAVFRRDVVDNLVSDQNFTFSDFFEASQTAQSRGFSAAGRTDQHQELFVLDCKIEILHGDNVAILFPNMIVRYTCHNIFLLT